MNTIKIDKYTSERIRETNLWELKHNFINESGEFVSGVVITKYSEDEKGPSQLVWAEELSIKAGIFQHMVMDMFRKHEKVNKEI